MKTGAKGSGAERELLNNLYRLGYSVLRSAGSGVNGVSPDLIAIKGERGFVFECKFWKGTPRIEHDKFEELKKWETNTMLEVYLAWKVSRDGWYFIKLDEMKKTPKSYAVQKRPTMKRSRRFEEILGSDGAMSPEVGTPAQIDQLV